MGWVGDGLGWVDGLGDGLGMGWDGLRLGLG